MATYKEKRGTNVVPIVSGQPETGVNGEIVYITGEGLASYNGGTWSTLTAVDPYKHWIGTSKSFTCGGRYISSGSYVNLNNIDAVSFASDGNATDWGDLIVAGPADGQTGSSPSDGIVYLMGRAINGYRYRVEKFSSASASNASTVGGEYVWNNMVTGAGEASAGQTATHLVLHSIGPNSFSTVRGFSFAAGTTTANDFSGGNTAAYGRCVTCSMETHMFIAGGVNASYSETAAKQIRKYANSGSSAAANHGTAELSIAHSVASSGTSDTHGFAAGGYNAGTARLQQISSFPYATETNSSDHGDLTFGNRQNRSGASSATHSYATGGNTASTPYSRNVIEKYSTVSAGNATDVGDLSNTVAESCQGYA